MTRAGRKTQRKSRGASPDKTSATERFKAFVLNRLTNPDPRSHAEFLYDMRIQQSAGRLANPATAALLDRLERAI